jgi:hypothetical protein
VCIIDLPKLKSSLGPGPLLLLHYLLSPNFPFSIYIMPPKSRIVETRAQAKAHIAEIRSQSAKKMDHIWQQLQQKHGNNDLYIEDEELESFATKKELQLNGKGEPVFSPCHFKLLPT